MEKYEINKYMKSFEKKVQDLYEALHIKESSEMVSKLSAEMLAEDFWSDSNRAQSIISKLNDNRGRVDSYESAKKGLSDLADLIEISELEDDLDAIDDEILNFDKKLDELETQTIFSGEYDTCNAILELHPGAGGTESMDWALMLYRMYLRYADKKNWKTKVLDYQAGEEAGVKSASILITGPLAYGYLKAERGVHRLVRISPFDTNKRRHTSFVSIDVTPQIDNNSEIELKQEEIKIDVFHSSGAGGQSVNTTDSAVRVTHIPTGIVVTCQNERSQIQNREFALNILKSKLLNLELKKREETLRAEKGEQRGIDFGSQIRSYVFHPYNMVKDHRTQHETGNISAVMDGDIDEFIISYLKQQAAKEE